MIKPLKPTVTLEEFLAFDVSRPETYTSSPQVNAVAEALALVRPTTEQEIARRLHVNGRKLSYALEIITGYGFIALRYYWIEHQYTKILKENPKISKDEMAHLLGFADSESLWHCLHSPGFKAKKRINVRKDAETESRIRDEKMRKYHEEMQMLEVRKQALRKHLQELEEKAKNGDSAAAQELTRLRRVIRY